MITYKTLEKISKKPQIRVKFILPRELEPTSSSPFRLEWLDVVKPVRREELASAFRISVFKAPQDRWSLFVFGDVGVKGVTYSWGRFKDILDEFEARNKRVVPAEKPSHEELKELIFAVGQMQGKNPEKEYELEGKRVDVVWRKTPRSYPYIVLR